MPLVALRLAVLVGLSQLGVPAKPAPDLIDPAVLDGKWVALDVATGLGAAELGGHLGPALDRWRLTLIGDAGGRPVGVVLSGWDSLWLVVPPETHRVQLQGDLRSDYGVGWLPSGSFRSGVSPFAIANPVSLRIAFLSDGQAGAASFFGWDDGLLAYTPNAEVGLSARWSSGFARLAARGGASLFWGDGQLATLDDAGRVRRGQSAPWAGAMALVAWRPAPRWQLRVAAEASDAPESLGAAGGRHLLSGRAGVWLRALHLEVGVEAWAFSAGRAPAPGGSGFVPARQDWMALATAGYSR